MGDVLLGKKPSTLAQGAVLGVEHPTVFPDRAVVKVSLGPHLVGASLPTPDFNDYLSNSMGAAHRFLRATPDPDPATLRLFRKFVRAYVRAHFDPICASDFSSVDEWLASTTYSMSRKEELIKAYNEFLDSPCPKTIMRAARVLSSHVKRESYPSYKFPRMINPRSDAVKVVLGPVTKDMERVVYGLVDDGLMPFIKHVPVRDRSRVICDALMSPGACYVGTDHTSFEAHIKPAVASACEMQLYSRLLSEHPARAALLQLMRVMLTGRNTSHFRGFTTSCLGVRMSGDMWTSLGNGFTNLMIMKFVCFQKGCHARGFVEGDDGIFAVTGPVPQPADFALVGMTVKMEVSSSPSDASFCGIVCDIDRKENVIDPIELLMSFGWSLSNDALCSTRLHRPFLVAKALSTLHEGPCSPVARELALMVLRCCPGVPPRWDPSDEYWGRQVMQSRYGSDGVSLDVCHKSVTMAERIVCESVYGLPIDAQLMIESKLRAMTSLGPLDFPECLPYVHRDCLDYARTYSTFVRIRSGKATRGSNVVIAQNGARLLAPLNTSVLIRTPRDCTALPRSGLRSMYSPV